MEGINLIDVPIYIINFAVTFVLLYLLLYKPISRFLDGRKERIANSLKEADTTQQEAQSVLEKAQKELASTEEKARQLSHETIKTAALDAEIILNNAEEEANTMIERAREQMRAEGHAALERAYTELVSLAGGLASRILTREVTLEDNRQIAERFFNEAAEQIKSRKAAAESSLNPKSKKSGDDHHG